MIYGVRDIVNCKTFVYNCSRGLAPLKKLKECLVPQIHNVYIVVIIIALIITTSIELFYMLLLTMYRPHFKETLQYIHYNWSRIFFSS